MSSLISFIIPAHNEAFEIEKTLQSVFDSARASGQPFEVIVVNDASTDKTAEIARHAGAHVVDVQLRKISAVRNAGARQATGDRFFFVDADTLISAKTLRAAVNALENGAIGGGAWVVFAEPVNIFIRITIFFFNTLYMKILRWAAGCFIFATREAFYAAGGFDESLYACEEVFLSHALKKQGPFAVLNEKVETSNRKMRVYSPMMISPLLFRFARHGIGVFKQREGLEWWYEGKRKK